MVTLRDVAKAAGTSVSAVSTVLNGRAEAGRIGAELQKRIEVTARDLGYRCNQLARSIATGLTRTIALVSDAGEHCEYFYELNAGILDSASAHQYALKIYLTAHQSLASILEHLVGERTGGVLFHIVNPGCATTLMKALDREQIPYGVVNTAPFSRRGFRVDSDDSPGVEAAVRHLHKLGHRRITYFDYNQEVASIYARREGYRTAMEQLGLIPDIISALEMNGPYPELQRRFSAPAGTRPTAVVGYSDMLALKAFGHAYELDLKVPADLSLVGFAGLSLADFSPVPLSTVKQPFQDMGRRGTELLLERIDHPERMAEFHTDLLPVMLSPGKSSAAAPNP